MPAKRSITVEQVHNPNYDMTKPNDPISNPSRKYRVEQTVNTLEVEISQYLTPSEVQRLIDADINVTIKPVK